MLRQLDQDLWVIDHPLKLMGTEFGTRTTVIRLRDGSLFVHAPGPWSAALRQSLRTLGPVKHVIAPNKMHWFSIGETMQAYPEADLYLAPGLAEKRPELPKGNALGEDAPEAWAGDLDQVWVHGAPMLEEIAFLHPASRTLLLTDLCFNFGRPEHGWTRWFLRLAGAHDRFGPSRIARSAMKDKAAVKDGIERILEWDFDRVTLTHGDVLETGGKDALRQAYAKIG